jgi:hypothetical protein
MAHEPGGIADKFGNRYESDWTVRRLLGLLNERIRSVRLEPLAEGVDLEVTLLDGVKRAEQCKSRNGDKDSWSVADLDRVGVLAKLRSYLDEDTSNQFALISAVGSALIRDICAAARASTERFNDFYDFQIAKKGHKSRAAVEQLAQRLEIDIKSDVGGARLLSYLKRFYIEHRPDTLDAHDDLLFQAQTLVLGDAGTVAALLGTFALENLRKDVVASDIWSYLESKGMRPRRLDNETRILPAVEELKTRFASSIRDDLVARRLIHREETDKVLKSLSKIAVVVLHGGPGTGKSGVLYELTELLGREGVAYLPIRLDRQEPSGTTRQFGEQLGLPESPVNCLSALAAAKPGILILDQLDAIRWTSRHSMNAMDVCVSLLREIRSLRDSGRKLSVVIACRTYDMENDPNISKWLEQEKEYRGGLSKIAVLPLNEADVKSVATRIGENADLISKRQMAILQSPQHLAMWARIVKEHGAIEFQSRVELMRLYWDDRLKELAKLHQPIQTNKALDSIVRYMEKNGSVSAPSTVLDDVLAKDALLAVGLITQDTGRLTFSHQSYLDYQVATRVVREIHTQGKGICDWLGDPSQQTLFRREQLRQALCLLAAESSTEFIKAVKDIISADSVRFHLKQLCLEVTGQLDSPPAELLDYLVTLTDRPEWTEHVLGTVFVRHSPFISWLLERGVLGKWLASDERRNYALWLLRSVNEDVPDLVAKALEPFMGGDDRWNEWVLAALPWDADYDSDSSFQLRLKLARCGVFHDFVNWTKLSSGRSLRLLEAVLSSWAPEDLSSRNAGRTGRGSRFESWTQDDVARLLQAAEEEPEAAWNLFFSQIVRLAPLKDEPYGSLQLWIEGDRFAERRGMEAVPHGVVRLASNAGKVLAEENGRLFWQRTAAARENPSPVVQFVLMEAYLRLPADVADEAIAWLLGDLGRLNIGSGENEPEWAPAARFIGELSARCSGETFRQLEQTLIHYHVPDEKRKAEYWLATWKDGYFGDYWGQAQHFLLPALCSWRRGPEATGLIGVLERKYEKYPGDRFLRRSHGKGGFVSSTLSRNLDRISDDAWIGIIGSHKVPLDDHTFKHWHDDHIAESSVHMFSRDLARMANRFPERFSRLALKFPEDVASDYRAAILEGLGNATGRDVPESERETWLPAPVALVEEVLEKFSAESDAYYAQRYCWMIHDRAEEDWSQGARDRLKDFACNSPNPDAGELAIGNDGGGFEIATSTISNLENNALNCVRGVAGLATGQILWNHPNLTDEFRPTLRHLCNDPHPAVRIAGIRACTSLIKSDKAFAIERFCEAAAADLRVAASHWATDYFNVGMESHYDLLRPIVADMIKSDRADVAEHGASEAVARWLFYDCFDDEVKRCLIGSVPQRVGAARTASHFMKDEQYFDKCRAVIGKLMNDPDESVRTALQSMLDSPDILMFEKGVDFARAFVTSKAFHDDPSPFVYALREYEGRVLPFADVLFDVCGEFSGPLKEATRDTSRGLAHDLSEILPTLLRVYEEASDSKNADVVKKCLDAFDRMFESRVGVSDDLAKIIG